MSPDELTAAVAAAHEMREAAAAPHRAFSSPRVEELRLAVPYAPTSNLIGWLVQPHTMPELDDASDDEISAMVMAVIDEIDRRLPVPRPPSP